MVISIICGDENMKLLSLVIQIVGPLRGSIGQTGREKSGVARKSSCNHLVKQDILKIELEELT